MASSTLAKPQYESITIQSKNDELVAEIVRLHKAISTKSEDYNDMKQRWNVEINQTRAFRERLGASEKSRIELGDRLIDSDNAKSELRVHSLEENNARTDPEVYGNFFSHQVDVHSEGLDGLVSALRASKQECKELVKDINLLRSAHWREVAGLKEAVPELEARRNEYFDETLEAQRAQERANTTEENTIEEILRLKGELAVSHQKLEDSKTDLETEQMRLRCKYRRKREEAIASLRDEYEKKGAALIARNTSLEVRVSQLQVEAKIHQAAISSLNHRHSVAKEALTSTMEQVHDFRDKFAMKAQICANLIEKHEVELRIKRREAAEAASRAEAEIKKYVEVQESQAADLVIEQESLKAKLASLHDRFANVYKEYKALQVKYSEDLCKERRSRALEHQLAGAGIEMYRARLKESKERLWTLAKRIVDLEKELEVHRRGEFGVEVLNEHEDEEQSEYQCDVPLEDWCEEENGPLGSE